MATTEAGQLAPVDRALLDVRKMLAVNSKGLSALLGNYMPMERYCGAILTLCRHNPDLLDQNKASRASLLLSVLRVAQLQLSPDPALGQAWIIPRKGRAEFQLGWKGCLALAYRHPLVAAVRYGVVGKNDRFVWEDGRNWRLEHDPSEEGWPETLDDVRAAWAILELRTGGAIPRVMYRAEILRHKGRGSGSQPAWATDPAAMAVKTVLGDACRRGPFEAEVGRAFNLDFSGEIGKGQPDDGTIDADYSVTDEPGAEKEGPLSKFKKARRPQGNGLDPEPPALEPEAEEISPPSGIEPQGVPGDASANPPDGGEVVRAEDFGPLGTEDDAPTIQAAIDAARSVSLPARLSREARARIRAAADAKGMDSTEMERIIGGNLDTFAATDETEILSKIQKAPKPPGRKR